jgi:hypothetical protein
MLGWLSCPKDDTIRMAHAGRKEKDYLHKTTERQSLSN